MGEFIKGASGCHLNLRFDPGRLVWLILQQLWTAKPFKSTIAQPQIPPIWDKTPGQGIVLSKQNSFGRLGLLDLNNL